MLTPYSIRKQKHNSYENRHRWHRHRNYWWVMLAIHAIQWLRGNWAATKSFPNTCLWGLWPRMMEYAEIGSFYSFLSSPSKLQIWKHRVLQENLVLSFHIRRFCRVFGFQGMYLYIYVIIYIIIYIYIYTFTYSYMYICNYKYIYTQIPMCIYFNYICNTVHSYLGNWVLHKYSMCSFSKLPNHAAISIGRCTHIVFTHSEHTHTYIYIYIYIYIHMHTHHWLQLYRTYIFILHMNICSI